MAHVVKKGIYNVRNWLTQEEIRALTQKSDWLAAWEVISTWALIAGALVACAIWPYWYVIVPALFVLGGRQLALGILLHDMSHGAFFKTKKLDSWIGQWLCAYPMFNDIHQYRPYHLLHHKHAGEEADPDLQIVRGYPTTPIGMIRKSLRDFLGYTGLKTYIGLTMIHLGFLSYSMGGKVERLKPTAKEVLVRAVKHLGGPLLVNAILFGICWLTGHPWVYLVWVGAMFSTSLFSFRVRAMAEHGVIELNERNDYPTRSTLANPLERLLFAPHNVNYHVEHHLLMTVPSYNLPKFHQLLKSKGFYQHAYLSPGYWDVILTVAGVRPPLRPEQPLAAA